MQPEEQIEKDIKLLDDAIKKIDEVDFLLPILKEVQNRYLDIDEVASIKEKDLKDWLPIFVDDYDLSQGWVSKDKVKKALSNVKCALEKSLTNIQKKKAEEYRNNVNKMCELLKMKHKNRVTIFVVLAVISIIFAGIMLVVWLLNKDNDTVNRVTALLGIIFTIIGFPLGLITWLIEKFYTKDDEFFMNKAKKKVDKKNK